MTRRPIVDALWLVQITCFLQRKEKHEYPDNSAVLQ